jgi:hypothetical protein
MGEESWVKCHMASVHGSVKLMGACSAKVKQATSRGGLRISVNPKTGHLCMYKRQAAWDGEISSRWKHEGTSGSVTYKDKW